MLSSVILIPPSPNWYGSQLVAMQPSTLQACYAGHSSVVVTDCKANTVLRTMCAGNCRVTALTWAPPSVHSHQLVAGHEDGSLRTWDSRAGGVVRAHKKKGVEVSALVVLARLPALVVVGDIKGGLQAWAFQSSAKPRPLAVQLRGKVQDLVVVPRAALAQGSGLQDVTSLAAGVGGLGLGDEGWQWQGEAQLVAAACADGSVTLLDVDAATALYCFTAHRGPVLSLSTGAASGAPPTLDMHGYPVLLSTCAEDASAKVWQLAHHGPTLSATLLATVSIAGAAGPRGGGQGRGSNRPAQLPWLPACLLPAQHKGPQAVVWMAVGIPTGEVQLFTVHTGTGAVQTAYRIHGVHTRVMYSVVAATLAPETVSAGGVKAAGDEAAKHSLLLLSISQDRHLVTTELHLSPHYPAPLQGNYQQQQYQQQYIEQGYSQPQYNPDMANPSGQAQQGMGMGSAGQAMRQQVSPVPSPAPALSPVVATVTPPAEVVRKTGGGPGGGNPPPVFRMARGPPTDSSIHGFGPRGAAAVAAAAESAAAAEAEAAAVVAPVPPRVVLPTLSTPGALAAPPQFGDMGASAGPQLLWKIAGCKPRWKLMGLGGYAHCVDSSVEGAKLGKEGGATLQWQLLVGCGDRMLRQATVAWALLPPRGTVGQSPREPVLEGEGGVTPREQTTGAEAAGTAAGAPGSSLASVSRLLPGRPSVVGSAMCWRNVPDQVLCVARHPASQRFLGFGCQDGQVGVYDTKVQAAHLYQTRHQGPVLSLSWLGQPLPTCGQNPAAQAASAEESAAEAAEGMTPGVEGSEAQEGVSAGGAGEGGVPPPPPMEPEQATEAALQGATETKKPQDKKGKAAKTAAAAEAALAAHAVLQTWQLVSCGAEGRLLAWSLPGLDQMAAAATSGGVPASGSYGRGANTDRSGRWGSKPQEPAAPVNDLAQRLLPLLQQHTALSPAPPSGDTVGDHSAPSAPPGASALNVTSMTTISTPAGTLVALAFASGRLALFRVQPNGTGGAGGGPAPGQVLDPLAALQWSVVWCHDTPGVSLAHVAAGYVPGASSATGLLALACSSTSNSLAIHLLTLNLPSLAASSSGPDAGLVSGAQQLSVGEYHAAALPDEQVQGSRVITSLAWLPGCQALAVGCGEDASVQVWGTQGGTGTAFTADTAAVLLCTLRGHTDHITGLSTSSSGLTGEPSDASPPASGQDQGPQGCVGSCSWLFTSSRDQSIRGWVLDVPTLHTQYGLQQLAAAQAAAMARADKLLRDMAVTEQATTAASESPAAPGKGAEGQQPAAAVVTGEEGAVSELLQAAPTKGDLAGVPGGRPKGARKVQQLGAKPLVASVEGGEGAGQEVLDAAQQAAAALTALLCLLDAPLTPGEGAAEEAQRVARLTGDPVALAATGQTQAMPERQVLGAVWQGDMRRALQLAVSHSLLTADLVSTSASLGRAVWAATSRLYAAQQERVGQAHVAVMHLVAIGDRPAAAAVYRRAGLQAEARAVDGAPQIITNGQ